MPTIFIRPDYGMYTQPTQKKTQKTPFAGTSLVPARGSALTRDTVCLIDVQMNAPLWLVARYRIVSEGAALLRIWSFMHHGKVAQRRSAQAAVRPRVGLSSPPSIAGFAPLCGWGARHWRARGLPISARAVRGVVRRCCVCCFALNPFFRTYGNSGLMLFFAWRIPSCLCRAAVRIRPAGARSVGQFRPRHRSRGEREACVSRTDCAC